MSRIGKEPIELPVGVNVKLIDGILEVSGPKGSLKRNVFSRVVITQQGAQIFVSPADEKSPQAKSFWGLYRTLLNNMVQGVSSGFEKILEVHGTGYRGTMEGTVLNLTLGFSHAYKVVPPSGISFDVDKTGKISIKGMDKELVGQIAAEVRAARPPDAYQGKGVRYSGEKIVLKVGKSAKK